MLAAAVELRQLKALVLVQVVPVVAGLAGAEVTELPGQQTLVAAVVGRLIMELMAALAAPALSSCLYPQPSTAAPQLAHPPLRHLEATPSSSSLLQGVTQREPLRQSS
jgi:hypothetical protein